MAGDAPVATADGLVVTRLQAAGAIVVGWSNTPAFAHTGFTTNRAFGPTRNPWNTQRSRSGSSGGSAAALAAGMVPLGATATSIADVLAEASVILGGTPGDPMSIPLGLVDLEPRRPTRVVATPTLRADVDDDMRAAFHAACAAFEAAGVEVEVRTGLVPTDATIAWFTIACADLAHALEPYRDRWEDAEESLALMLGFGDAANSGTILMSPVVNVGSWGPEGPLPIRAGTTDDLSITTNTTDLNMSGHPAVSVPTGFDAHGVPIGMQLVSARYDDGLALGAATLLEEVDPWPLHREGYTQFGL